MYYEVFRFKLLSYYINSWSNIAFSNPWIVEERTKAMQLGDIHVLNNCGSLSIFFIQINFLFYQHFNYSDI